MIWRLIQQLPESDRDCDYDTSTRSIDLTPRKLGGPRSELGYGAPRRRVEHNLNMHGRRAT
jgi:hypothetical protein